MDNVSLGLVSLGVGLVNLILAIVTLGAITYFWLRHHRAGLNRAWWVLAIGFAAFAIAQTLEYRRLLTVPGQLSVSSLEITARTVFVCFVSLGLWRLFDESLKTKQRSLDTAETTIQVMRLQADTTRQGNELALLLRTSHLLTGKSSLQPILEELCRAARETIKAQSVWIRLRQSLSDGFQLAADPPLGSPGPTMISPRIEGVFGEVMRTGKPVVKEISAPPLPGDPQPRHLVLGVFPLLHGHEPIGALILGYDIRHIFSADDQRLATGLADQAAIAVIHSQLTEQAELNARVDSLTRLANRRHFNETLRTETQRASRYKLPLALMLVHLEKLREYNKTFGQLAGDAYLKFFAQYLRQHSRDSDLVARLGDDEFGILMPNTHPDRVRQAADRLKNSFLDMGFEWEKNRLPVVVSIGYAGWEPGEATQPDALLAAASRGLYSGALDSKDVAERAKLS